MWLEVTFVNKNGIDIERFWFHEDDIERTMITACLAMDRRLAADFHIESQKV